MSTGRLPAAVSRALERLTPATLVVEMDAAGQVAAVHGNAGQLGLSHLRPGLAAAQALPFLVGCDLARPCSWSCLEMGGSQAVDIELIPAPGSAFLVMVSVEQQRLEQQQVQLIANEARLINYTQQRLVDQLVEARSELDLRRREAEDALRAKTRFIASLSHEFRTPLTSVIGYAEWLAGTLEDSAQRQSRAIVRAGQHMLSMVDNLLEQARLQTDNVELHPEPVKLRTVAEDISAIMAPLAADKGIAFGAFVDPALPEVVLVDEMRLRQILINLLGNAVKFTSEGSVQMRFGFADGQLHLEVADTGPGIRDEDRSRIFSAFERLEGAHSQAGAGLGLHITLQLVRLMQGSIGLDSQPGRGTRFHVRLPVQPAEKTADAESDAGSAHLLVAEDDPDLVQLLQLYLVKAGYRLTLAGDGREAVNQALRLQPELVLLDINMPVVDGITAVRQLRERGYRGAVVALSGATLDEERMQAIAAGFDAFIAKPIRMPELMSAVRDLLAR